MKDQWEKGEERVIGNGKWVVALSLILALAAVILLAGRLSAVELEQGAILVSGATPTPNDALREDLGGRRTFLNIPLLDAISLYVKFVFWGLIPITLIVFLFAPGNRWRRILVTVLTLTGVLTAANMLRDFRAQLGSNLLGDMESFAPEALEGTPLVAPTTTEPTSTFNYLVSFLVSAGFVVLVWLIWRWWNQRPRAGVELAREAERAAEQIRSGADVSETVLACYYRMNEILAEQAGYRRREGMTPREFEISLGETGLPHRHIQRLTRLFERARYGGRDVGDRNRRSAAESLRAIAENLREST